MKRLRQGLAAVAVWAVTIAAAAPAGAQAAATAASGAEAAAARVREATDGRVLGVRRTQRDRRPVYAVRVLLPDGRVTTRFVDAAAVERQAQEAASGAREATPAAGR